MVEKVTMEATKILPERLETFQHKQFASKLQVSLSSVCIHTQGSIREGSFNRVYGRLFASMSHNVEAGRLPEVSPIRKCVSNVVSNLAK